MSAHRRSDELTKGDICLSRLNGKARYAYRVAEVVEQPAGVTTIRFVGGHQWVVPVQEMREVAEAGDVLELMSGGDTVYVYDADDPNIDVMELTLYAANLGDDEVNRWLLPADAWPRVDKRLRAGGIKIVDTRSATTEQHDENGQ